MQDKIKFSIIGLILGAAVVGLVPLMVKDLGGKIGQAPAAGAPAAGGALGSFDGKTLSASDLSSAEKMKLYEAESAYYNAVEDLVTQRYIESFFEGYQKQNNLPSMEAAQEHFFKGKTNVSEAEVNRLLEENKDNPNLQRIPEGERANQVRQFLTANSRRTAMRDFAMEARGSGKIQVSVPKPTEPRMEVTDGGNPFLGAKDAKVTIVEFLDYQCPFCARAIPTMKEILKKYDGKVRWVIRDFPLREIHPEAMPAALVANCAGEQGKYFEMHDALFEKHRELNAALYPKLAEQIKLDMNKFNACIKDSSKEMEVLKDYGDGIKYGVNGTPAFYVNGRRVSNGLDVNTLSVMIEEELKR